MAGSREVRVHCVIPGRCGSGQVRYHLLPLPYPTPAPTRHRRQTSAPITAPPPRFGEPKSLRREATCHYKDRVIYSRYITGNLKAKIQFCFEHQGQTFPPSPGYNGKEIHLRTWEIKIHSTQHVTGQESSPPSCVGCPTSSPRISRDPARAESRQHQHFFYPPVPPLLSDLSQRPFWGHQQQNRQKQRKAQHMTTSR